jgi:hypothetical protein
MISVGWRSSSMEIEAEKMSKDSRKRTKTKQF